MKSKFTMSGKRKQAHRYVDIGFGTGEHLKRLARGGLHKKGALILEGVEKNPVAYKKEYFPDKPIPPIPGASLRFDGYEKWLEDREAKHYTGINFGLFWTTSFVWERRNIAEDLKWIREKIRPGGIIRLVVRNTGIRIYEKQLRDAGFVGVHSKPMDLHDFLSHPDKYTHDEMRGLKAAIESSNPEEADSRPVVITARRPKERKKRK